MTAFDDIWCRAALVPGWLTQDQARTLWESTCSLPAGAGVVEIGSHQGRSTLVLAAATAHCGARLTAIDPFVSATRYGGDAARTALLRHLHEAGLTSQVDLLVAKAAEVRRSWDSALAVVFVDGKHDYWTTTRDLGWADFLAPGGLMLVHDSFSSIGVTTALLRRLGTSRSLRYEGRVGTLAALRRQRPTAPDRARLLRELPWWARNVVIKVLLRLRLRTAARRLGHDSPWDPY